MTENITEVIAGLFLFAAVVEGILTYFIPKNPDNAEPRQWVKYASAALGIIVCVAYKADLLEAFGYTSFIPYVGSILTGIIIGRGSNFLNDFFNRIKNPTPAVVIESKGDTTIEAKDTKVIA